MGFIFSAVFFVMLIIILFKEGWLKLLKLVGLWFVSSLLIAIIMVVIGFERDSAGVAVMNLMITGGWSIGLVVYNIKEGYIGNI